MARTRQRFPGPLIEEEICMTPQSSPAAQEGKIVYLGAGRFSMFDSVGEFDPRTGAASLAFACSPKELQQDYTILAGTCCFGCNEFCVADGVTLTIEDNAELVLS